MRLIGFMTYRDEEDILHESVPDFCRKLDVLVAVDCGSEDRSQEIVRGLESQHPNLIHLPTLGPHHPAEVRRHFWHEIRQIVSRHDWLVVADADEFIHSDIRSACNAATNAGANIVHGIFANFYYTDAEYKDWLEGRESLMDRQRPIAQRRLNYRLQTMQVRAFRFVNGYRWNSDGYYPSGMDISFDQTVLFRHYQYRDPAQIEKRQQIRSKFDPSVHYVKGDAHWRAASFEEKISRGDPLMRRWDGVSDFERDPHLPAFNIYPPLWKRVAKRARRFVRATITRQQPCQMFEGSGLADRLKVLLK